MNSAKSTWTRFIDSKYSTPAILITILIVLDSFVWWLNIPFIEDICTVATITLIMVLGFQLFMGNSGILNWSYAGYIGIGAFASAIFSMTPEFKAKQIPVMYEFLVNLHLPFPLALIAGALFAALVAAVIAWPLMRLTDSVGAITQFALLIVINTMLNQWQEVTNGPRTFTVSMGRITDIWLALFVAVLVILAVFWFKESSVGLKLRASRDDRYAARSSGINIIAVRYYGYVTSAFIGGLAGGLFAHYIVSITAMAFYMGEVFVLLTMTIIGGSMSVSGAFFGTLLITVSQQLLRQLESIVTRSGFEASGTTDIVLGLLMIGFLALLPNGVTRGKELSLSAIKRFLRIGNNRQKQSKGLDQKPSN
ncbi:MAG: branched-chain amino acid ABC transporter permease [Coriobacteriales bacterium]|jgi:branched-chain amino acid transport system permease protein|nr:branched-chain amino acid ABC transporter permease [Coriobacteriales bacterium]